jgi:hypothetical protein
MYLRADLLALGARRAAQLEAEGDVAQHVRPGQQREILEHEARSAPGPSTAVPLTRLPGVARDQSGDDLEQRGLAAAARAEQGGELALRKGEVDVAQGLARRCRRSCDAFDLDDRFSHGGKSLNSSLVPE